MPPQATSDIPQTIVLMGVCGCGKSSVGEELVRQIGGIFEDGDDFHSPEAKAKMASGVPLDDDDRKPWFARMRKRIEEVRATGGRYVLACSALKAIYREWLRADDSPTELQFVHLAGSRELIQARMDARKGHFMPPSLLDSQFATLERPNDAVEVSIDQSVLEIVAETLQRLRTT
ncbi:MAG: gluconokinase [Verrucomicrobiaceae bacterium]|nr:gluconokinase [Verrucomicrobiaceae bacterium]